MFFAFISASVYGIIDVLDPEGVAVTRDRNLTTDFVESQIRKMPRGLRWGIYGLILFVHAYSLFLFRHFPKFLNRQQRMQLMLDLKNSRFGFLRDLSQLLFSLTAMGFFSFREDLT